MDLDQLTRAILDANENDPGGLILQEGTPPFPGWWLTQSGANPLISINWRWWNGSDWSMPADPSMDSEEAEYWARRTVPPTRVGSHVYTPMIGWCWYWPSYSKVLRAFPPDFFYGDLPAYRKMLAKASIYSHIKQIEARRVEST